MDPDILCAFRNNRRLRRSAWGCKDPLPHRLSERPPNARFRPAAAGDEGTLGECAC